MTKTDLDVVIVGAGISGIDAAYHLRQRHPDRSLAILEQQDNFGGTWHTHRYPGARSDSDLYTFGFGWKPWTGTPIATAEEIRAYLDEALSENDLHRHIRYRHRVLSADWEGDHWRVRVQGPEGPVAPITCRFLWMCQGYYRHEAGYVPDFAGKGDFDGLLVHPQTWPKDLDYSGKRVVVIGSGATAATLVPAMAGTAAHVTMLQRSPTYFYPRPKVSPLEALLAPLGLPPEWTHEILRRRYLLESGVTARRAREEPEALRADLLAGARAYLGEDFPIDPHFTPRYAPWRQRIAVVPDGDLFAAIARGEASVVTDEIERFTPTGIALASGGALEADIIVTATGFNLSMMGGIPFTVDGDPVDWPQTWAHRGIMYSGVPNLAWVFGYLRSSWTLRADMISDFVCRLLAHMDASGSTVVTPQLRPEDADMPPLPFIDPENFNAGYIVRQAHILPKQGDRAPWIFSQDYYREREEIPCADLEDGTLIYGRRTGPAAVA
ncbi:flavin-containing monooxygenase [Jannaschia seohaensis]|uniref:Cation diffusion facilitator CzcD-associated flavoprotein CzcO n=1 Tax=Jannaschia seohaensis TaxID=475081 RepID=A0A2Y9AZ08_9RHOB|nr:NAD(P)/FAD-dependent oxidoreductase [Jannaschia seohaensis]PWJ15827.1 cation diffusion facilitator CzcD-associated flavoprotein CzcO [Jannaschia seohaensis]SSA49520.1 Predicted flavoprotein CzcO associated with the cation diffusion facilitator CzcD [Jannaschia seohaensis]